MKANDTAGDGTTTSAVLAQAMVAEAFKIVDEHPEKVAEVRAGLQVALAEAKRQLDSMARPVENRDAIKRVALISSLDEDVAEAIANAFETLGNKATVIVEETNRPGITLETTKGLRLPKGILNDWFIADFTRNETRLERPAVIVTDKRISSAQDMGTLLTKLQEAKILTFVLLAEEISAEALATLAVNTKNGLFNCIPVVAPYGEDRRRNAYEDIAALTGTGVISERLGHKFQDLDVSKLGSCKRVISNKNHTTFVEGTGDVSERVQGIEAELKEAKAMYDREVLQERLSGLTGGIGVITVGAFSESELRAKRYKVEDALNATKAAIEEGVVPGGGAALLSLTGNLGSPILDRALGAPYAQMAENSGRAGKNMISNLPGETAFNWKTGELVDAYEAGILDPVKVTKSSLESAVSVVSTVLSVGSLIVEVPEKDQA